VYKSAIEKTAFWKAFERFLRGGLILFAILVTCITFAAVITRQLNINFLGYEEILIICAFWLYMFGTAHGSFEQSHITADIVVVMMPESRLKSTIAILRNTLTVILSIIFLGWAWQLFIYTIEMGNKTPVWRIPMTVSQSSLLFGLACTAFFFSIYLYDEWRTYIGKYIKKTIPITPSDDSGKEV